MKVVVLKHVLPVYLFLLLIISCKKSSSGSPDTNTPDPAISIEDLSLFEGTAATPNTFNIIVKLSTVSAKQVSVKYATAEGTAKSGADFTAVTNQIVTFQPGEKEKTIAISIVADDLREADNEFIINLSGPVNATIQKGTANIIMKNDDTKIHFANTGYDAPITYTGYTLSWADEFNGTALDATAWAHQNGDGCPSVCGWGNNELEYYTDRPQNIFFQDGKLIIEAKKEIYNGRNYTSSKIVTAGKKTFKFGRVDIRAKLPTGKGIWPAFWMLPQNNVYGGWPTSGEIDIMEMVGHDPSRTHGTLHYGPGPGSTQYNRSIAISSGTLHDEFHVYSIEWKQDQVKWFLDGNLFSTADKADLAAGTTYPFNEDFYFIINLAVGGNWPGNPDVTTSFPQWLIVDYIRVYQ